LTHDKLTHDNDNQAPTERPAQDTALSLLTMASPAFRFSFLSAGFHRAKWPTLRRRPADRGERKDASPDRDDLRDELGPAVARSDSNGTPSDQEHVDADG